MLVPTIPTLSFKPDHILNHIQYNGDVERVCLLSNVLPVKI